MSEALVFPAAPWRARTLAHLEDLLVLTRALVWAESKLELQQVDGTSAPAPAGDVEQERDQLRAVAQQLEAAVDRYRQENLAVAARLDQAERERDELQAIVASA